MIAMVTAQQVAFWILAPLAVLGALGMVVSHKPVHSAVSLAGMMVALGCLYASIDAPFLFVAQILVYTGAVMMLFLFTMMIVGIDTYDSLIETIKGQRLLALVFAAGLGVLLILAVGNGITAGAKGLEGANADGNVVGVARLIFGSYIYPFEVTAALVLTAAVAAIVLAQGERLHKPVTQRQLSKARTKAFAETGRQPGPLPNPGVYARHNSVDYPALLPDGSVAESSVSPTLAVRGVAIVTNEGLREAHREAVTSYVAATDKELAARLAQELNDVQPTGKPSAALLANRAQAEEAN